MLEISDISVTAQNKSILQIDHLLLPQNQLTVVIGHNGSGKSTLLKILARQLKPSTGKVLVSGTNIDLLNQKKLAQKIAFLPQQLPNSTGLTVQDLVILGRFPWQNFFSRNSANDINLTHQAMEDTHTLSYKNQLVDNLSGGERQRAWIAMLLAQQAPMLLLDEPVSALDLAHQYKVMALLKKLRETKQYGIIVILHDINLAIRFADRIIGLKNGQLMLDCPPKELLYDTRLSQLYGIQLDFIEHPQQNNKIAVVSQVDNTY